MIVIVGCVAAGMGISLMPRLLIDDRRLRDSVGVHPIAPRLARVATELVWHKDADSNPARDGFFQAMQEAGGRSANRPRGRRTSNGSSRRPDGSAQ